MLRSKIFLLVLVLFFKNSLCLALSDKNDTKQFRYDYTYDARADGWFKVHPVPVNWQKARLICHSEGAELASPLNPGMLESINELVLNTEPKLNLYYSGVHQTFGDGIFMSVEGVPLEKLHIRKWGKKEPNGYGMSQDCLVYSNDETIWDFSCEEYLPFICYRSYSERDILTECGTVDKGYEMAPQTGHCYKIHNRAKPWAQAHRICQAEGGYLAVINSQEEVTTLDKLFNLSPKPLYTEFVNTAAIGFREWGENGGWWTVQGQTLAEAGFEQWGVGQPNTITYPNNETSRRQSCGGLRNQELDDIWCDVPFAFICEKTPNSLIERHNSKE